MAASQGTDDRILVSLFFDYYVFGFMKHDVEAAINGQANFLAALGLAAYSEIMGALRLGTIQDKFHNKEKFEAFLPYLDAAYSKLDSELKTNAQFPGGLYEVVRSGLAHQYFVKEPAEVFRHGVGEPAGIFRDQVSGKLVLVAKRFLDDFLVAAAKVRDDILATPDPRTLAFMRLYVDLGDPRRSGIAHSPTPVTTSGGTFTNVTGAGSGG